MRALAERDPWGDGVARRVAPWFSYGDGTVRGDPPADGKDRGFRGIQCIDLLGVFYPIFLTL